ncbi:type VI secretion system baseplate subunit TssF [Cognatiyoonia sp. IB215446]|uniref:type VI secretion system baseplate subunit TssF n=1 Tax=Cognatiyoonia sp. IB215446 TaxID=3097355 RepID=UPI002A17B502|nr:type VI secretion system baseplate subunit TssF [Cognatiyoonia sp. IB215446]MDX8346882.1 type VI secretion system baseplate subunit TssF [Cognatiyoonia sp. IB215446]
MDTRLLKHYEQELTFMREMGSEFASTYPKIAGRLGMDQLEVLDPYVERMLEGFAFLAARVQLELDLQYPVFTQNLLEIVYPHFLAPIPSMMIARLTADAAQGNLDNGFTLPRGTQLRGHVREGEQTACLFRTSQDVTLWPLEISEAEYVDGRSELVAAGLAPFSPAKAALRLRIRRTDGAKISELPLDQLTLFLSGSASEPWRLYEAMLGQGIGLAGRSTDRRADWAEYLGTHIRPRGFDPDEALLPTPGQSFEGYRLLQEYFAMPQRFFFVELGGLQNALQRAEGDDLDIYVLLRDGNPALKSINHTHFELHAVPAINLFSKRCDRVHINSTEVDHHVTVDRTAPLDYEIYQLNSVTGISGEGENDVAFRPFYSAQDFTPNGDTHQAYYSQRRRMRQRSEKQRLKGARTSYLGSEIYLSLTDRQQAPYRQDLKQLAVTALCTNRDLPMLTPIGQGETDFTLPDGGPVSEVRAIVPPTKPRPSLADGQQAWQLISHLSLNYLSIADADRGKAATALREIMGLYMPLGAPALSKQVEGLLSVETRPIVRRMAEDVLSTAVRGIEIKVGFDESQFEGTGCYLMGAVLEAFFAKYVTLNSFTETVIHSTQRGDIKRWPARSGRRVLI